MRRACDYVHLNPLRAHLISKGETLENYHWSSFNNYLQLPHQRYSWLRVDRLFGEHGIQKDNADGRREFSRLMNLRCALEINSDQDPYTEIQRGWKFGSQKFIERLHDKMVFLPDKKNHIAAECNETIEAFGRRLIKEKLNELKVSYKSLDRLSKTAPIKLELAEILRSKTTLSMQWIASELKAGVRKTLSNALWQKRRQSKSSKSKS